MKNLVKLNIRRFAFVTGVFLAPSLVYAGGITPQKDAVVTCRGEQVELLFGVFKSAYNGEMLQLNVEKGAVLRITDMKLAEELFAQNFLKSRVWDRRPFLKSIGLDPKDFKDLIAGSVAQTREGHFKSSFIGGGTLDEDWTASMPVHATETQLALVDESLGQRYFSALSVDQLGENHYRIRFTELTAGQQRCVETKLVPNPYANDGTLVEVCSRFIQLSEQSERLVAEKEFRINSCQL